MRLHHVQISMPAGGETEARAFYGQGLGLIEVAKPPALAGRGGCWFRSDETAGGAELHLGVDEPFTPAAKAHPGLVVADVAELDSIAERLASLGYEVSWAERDTFAGYRRFHCRDGFGNRVEVMTPAPQ